MEFFANTPYIIRVLGSLLVILVVNKAARRLHVAVFAGIAVLALWTGQSMQACVSITLDRILSPNAILLMVIIFQVIWLSTQMSMTGVMKDMVGSINSMVSRRASMALLPAVIGLLPMPGGAIFSAPLVDDCDTDNSVDPLLKARINYWFRHIWEYWWPMYPGFLLALEITGLPMLSLMMVQFPLSIFAIFGGYIFLLKKVEPGKNGTSAHTRKNMKEFLLLVSPIFIIIFTYAGIKVFIPEVAAVNRYLPMITGILIAQAALQIRRPLGAGPWLRIIFSVKTLNMALIVLLILVYGAFIRAPLPDGSMIMGHMRGELASWGIPVFFIIMIIPFISGMTTGLAVGFVGASFPIIMSLIGPDPGIREVLSTIVLAYGSGYIGMIFSPVHVCLIVTSEHFRTGVIDSLARLVKPALVVCAGILLIHLLLR